MIQNFLNCLRKFLVKRLRDKFLKEILRDDAWDFVPRTFERGPFNNKIKKRYKVSICTTCMGRADDVKQTYIQNIKDNIDYYPNVEFVLLNYNSKDDLDEWVYKNLIDEINFGIVNYYHTIEPRYYSMTHSRNIAFKVASGDIVNNVDADHFTNFGFASHINLLANQQHKKSIFLKSKQKNRGRLGFFKKDFMWLRGYSEDIEGYGHDDVDLLNRALCADFTAYFFGGQFCRITPDHRRHPTDNYKIKDWRYTQRKNTLISLLNLKYKKIRANEDIEWGKAKLVKNFNEEIDI